MMYKVDGNETMNICMSPEGGNGASIMTASEKPVLHVEAVEQVNYFGEGRGMKEESLF